MEKGPGFLVRPAVNLSLTRSANQKRLPINDRTNGFLVRPLIFISPGRAYIQVMETVRPEALNALISKPVSKKKGFIRLDN